MELIIFGLIFFVIGFLIITGTYAIFVYAMLRVWDSPIHDTNLMMIVVPGMLLIIFLILSVLFTKKMLKNEKWKRTYTFSMIFYLFSLGYYYSDLGEPVQNVITFANFCFVLAAIFLLVGYKKKEKQRQPVVE